eukprot:gene27532-33962_t
MRGTVIPLKYKAPKVVIGTNALQREKRVTFARQNRDRSWKRVLWTDRKYFVDTLILGAKSMFAAHEPNSWVFMQDGAKPHTTKVTQKWLAENVPSYITAWPPNSPDLNPIENLWAVMARSLAGSRFKNIDELKEGIQKAWDDIPTSTMRNIVG